MVANSVSNLGHWLVRGILLCSRLRSAGNKRRITYNGAWDLEPAGGDGGHACMDICEYVPTPMRTVIGTGV